MSHARIAELEARIADKLAYGVKCTRDMNELARLKDATRTPFVRFVYRALTFLAFVVVGAIAYAPIVLPFAKFFVGG